MRHTCLRITTLSVVCAGFFYSVTPQAQARSHAMTEMEADRLTLSALTAPPPPVRHVVYRRAVAGHHVVVASAHHTTSSHVRHSLVHEVSYRPHGTTAIHHVTRTSLHHRT
ncbi:hypothetical protein NO263_05820 [Gluconacetobacter entanii]|uniref:Uncharacterized protein n=1 Tax=Gluconacetobacter entanii TaxID=108528 RepID=A0ABT3K3W4_9PROT|nr:hypothetical protein [Gluconacetobacter entanii]MCW4590098.1 hypothetical protein [Gluconacetobacter entanii]MCW4594713.1 hypothetical protein [Gluconacetobacter entanii]